MFLNSTCLEFRLTGISSEIQFSHRINHSGVFARGDGTSLRPRVSRQKKSNCIRNCISVKSFSEKYPNLFLTILAYVLMIANPTLKLSNIISRVINMKVADQLIQKATLVSNVIRIKWWRICTNRTQTKLLRYWGQVNYTYVTELSHYPFKKWRVQCLSPSHNLNQC